MVTFLFWNLNKKPLEKTIASIALRYKIDILMFAESSIWPNSLLYYLNSKNTNSAFYRNSTGIGCNKIEIYTRFGSEFIKPIYEMDRLTIRYLKLPGLTSIILAVCHLRSKLHTSSPGQSRECSILIEEIEKVERKLGHTKTILVGDFNMNPFEDGIVTSGCLHATMSRNIAEKEKRTVQGKEYLYFYNPMWNLLGDIPSPPGTYYYPNSDHKSYFWNMFDQVLIRPQLLDMFESKDLMILAGDDNISLVNRKGLPNKKDFSDHLPIIFKLKLAEEN